MNPILYRYKDTESVIKVMDGYTPGDGWEPLFDEAAVKAATHTEYKRFEPLQDAAEDIINNNGHMNTELLARLRAAFEKVVT